MATPENLKTVPRSILVFGAGAHIGLPLARFLQREAPDIRLRLVSNQAERRQMLRREFPQADVMAADYFRTAELDAAVADMEGLFIITPGGTDEGVAMTNLVESVQKAGCAVQLLRCLGMQPEANLHRLPLSMTAPPALGLPVQHPKAKRILDESGLPVTYLNFGASFMDNYFMMKAGLVRSRKLIWHNRKVPFIDPRDIAEVAGRVFLSDNHRHIGLFHTLNNGHDLLRQSDVAGLMSEVFGQPIGFDGSRQGFFDAYGHLGPLCHVLWAFFEYEQDNEVVWALNDFVERTLGRKPLTLREWLREHQQALLA